MKIYSWNVNGIRSVAKNGFVAWLTKEKPDILCVQETKAHPDQLSFDLKMIDHYRVDFASAHKAGYMAWPLIVFPNLTKFKLV